MVTAKLKALLLTNIHTNALTLLFWHEDSCHEDSIKSRLAIVSIQTQVNVYSHKHADINTHAHTYLIIYVDDDTCACMHARTHLNIYLIISVDDDTIKIRHNVMITPVTPATVLNSSRVVSCTEQKCKII